MGQCYSVALMVNIKNNAEFVKLSRSFIETQNIREDCFIGVDLTTPEGNVKFMLAGYTQPDNWQERDEGDGWREYGNGFDASYSWDGLMEEWFRAIAPTLETGSDIEVWPDSGSWHCQVGVDGKILKTTTEEEDEGEEE